MCLRAPASSPASCALAPAQAALCYTGDVFQGESGARGRDYRYKLDYYLRLARAFTAAGAHVLSIKDMAGLLTPQSTSLLVGALRREYPAVPIHVHTHDTLGECASNSVNRGTL